MYFFATCVYLRVRLATQRKSLRKFNLCPLATTWESVWPRLNTIIVALPAKHWVNHHKKCWKLLATSSRHEAPFEIPRALVFRLHIAN